jgi:hypothetical protein
MRLCRGERRLSHGIKLITSRLPGGAFVYLAFRIGNIPRIVVEIPTCSSMRDSALIKSIVQIARTDKIL